MKLSFCLSSLVSLALASSALGGTFTDSLKNGLDSNYWTVIHSNPNLYTEQETANGVVLTKTGTVTNTLPNYIGLNLDLSAIGGNVSGDFDIKVSFTNAVLGSSFVDQIELHPSFADSSVFFGVFDNGGLSAAHETHLWNGTIVNVTAQPGVTAGTFEISRTGSTLSYLFNNTSIATATNNSALTGVSFVLQNNAGSNDNIAVTYNNFSLTGANIHAVPEPATLVPVLISGFASLVLFRRRKA